MPRNEMGPKYRRNMAKFKLWRSVLTLEVWEKYFRVDGEPYNYKVIFTPTETYTPTIRVAVETYSRYLKGERKIVVRPKRPLNDTMPISNQGNSIGDKYKQDQMKLIEKPIPIVMIGKKKFKFDAPHDSYEDNLKNAKFAFNVWSKFTKEERLELIKEKK